MTKKQVILIILDGWGYSPIREGNAIAQAKLPFYNTAWQQASHTLLKASSEAVGLRWGELGNSEVGHMAIGTGRVIPGLLTEITAAINNRSFYDNPALNHAIDSAESRQKALHIIGLASAGAVHSHIEHLEAILSLVAKKKFRGPLFLHLITDGRDTGAKLAPLYIKKAEKWLEQYKLYGRIASISGRYWAMDRDNRWPRTRLAYDTIIGKGEKSADNALAWITEQYAQDHNDEFIEPATIRPAKLPQMPKTGFGSKKYYSDLGDSTIKAGDSLLFFNFRPDRMRQLMELFCLPSPHFPDLQLINDLTICTLTEYSPFFNVKVAFRRGEITHTLADQLSSSGLSQLHIGETEKFAHVTYFFNAVQSEKQAGEAWQIVPSPKVATYDKAPEMSAEKVTQTLKEAFSSEFYDFVVLNFANADMVGHTGDMEATIKAVESIDTQLKAIYEHFKDSHILITADHGNAEQMLELETGSINKEHTLNPVPLIYLDPAHKLDFSAGQRQAPKPNVSGILADIAPTILAILELPKPPEMSGISLLDSLTNAVQD